MLCFLAAVEMKPLTLWACQSVAFMISARVAPFARPIISRIFAPLLSARGALALRSGLAAFLLALASFFGAAALALAPWRSSGLGRALLLGGTLLRGGLLRRDVRALFRNGGGLGGFGGFVVLHGPNPFCSMACASSRTTIHHSG